MPALSPERRTAQARHAAASRYGRDTTETARTLAALQLEDYIRRTVDAAPKLTPAQVDRLAVLLRGESA